MTAAPRTYCGSWLACDGDLGAGRIAGSDRAHIHFFGQGHYGFRPYGGSLWKSPKVTKGLLPHHSAPRLDQKQNTAALEPTGVFKRARLQAVGLGCDLIAAPRSTCGSWLACDGARSTNHIPSGTTQPTCGSGLAREDGIRAAASVGSAQGHIHASLALVALLAFSALPAFAEPLLERAQSRGTLNVCTSDEFPPFKTLDAQGKPSGLIMDLIVDLQQQLSARVGQPLKLSLVQVNPLNRLLFLDQGRCEVLVTSLLDTPARRREVDFASPGFYSSAATVFAPKSTAVPDWESLRGKTLCAPATSVWVRPFENRYGVQFASFNGTAEVRKAVADSRCLGAMGDDALYSALARQPEWADYEVKLPGQDPAPWGIALRKGQPELLAAVSEIVEGWHANGLIIQLEQRYGLAPNAWVAQQHSQARHE